MKVTLRATFVPPLLTASMPLKQRVSMLNLISNEHPKSPLLQTWIKACADDVSAWNHHSGVLVIRAISRSGLEYRCDKLLDVFCLAQSSKSSEWTPQSISLFAYYLSRLTRSPSSVVRSLLAKLVLGNRSFADFSDQNLCNLIVGLGNLGIPDGDALEECSKRSLAKRDVLFLLRSNSPEIVALALCKLGRLSVAECVVACNIISKECLHLLASTIVDQLELWLASSTDSRDGENLVYIMNKLNYRPRMHRCLDISFDCRISGKTASQVLAALHKLDIRLKSWDQIEILVKAMTSGAIDSSEVATATFALSAMVHKDVKSRIKLINDLIDKVDVLTLNPIDRRQVARACSCLVQDYGGVSDGALFATLARLLQISEPWEMSAPPRSSKVHSRILASLQAICGRNARTEVLVHPISSYIDILVSSE
jgi:hypothetical protein